MKDFLNKWFTTETWYTVIYLPHEEIVYVRTSSKQHILQVSSQSGEINRYPYVAAQEPSCHPVPWLDESQDEWYLRDGVFVITKNRYMLFKYQLIVKDCEHVSLDFRKMNALSALGMPPDRAFFLCYTR